MFEEFDIHNQFKESLLRFKRFDPHLKKIKDLPLVYESPLLEEPFFHNPGIYLVTGGRQVGKTTFLKQLILRILKNRKLPADCILFLSGELIDTHHILGRIINYFHDPAAGFQYLFVDEINYIPYWDKAIKYYADAGLFDRMAVILTGSDSQIIKAAMKRFAGRRGRSDRVDFNFYPLSFKEFVCLKEKKLRPLCKKIVETPLTTKIKGYETNHTRLNELLKEYLIHGGYLPAITDFNATGSISMSVLTTYIQWIIGDMLKFNKNENYLFEILKGIKTTYTSQISWNSIGKHLSIEHHKTVSDYCNLLEAIHVLHIQEALIEHKLAGAPKKNRKLYFRDPFIDHAVTTFIEPSCSIDSIIGNIKSNQGVAPYIEAVVVDHFKRWCPTYYIKGQKGEVDIAIVKDKKFFPVEVKWTTRLRPEELKQVQRYDNGIIVTPHPEGGVLGKNRIIPIQRLMVHISGQRFDL